MSRLYSSLFEPEFEDGPVAVYARFGFDENDIATVARNMRETDVFEFGCAGYDNTNAVEIAKWASDTYLVTYHDEPVFIGGVDLKREGLYDVFGFGTADTPAIIPAITSYIKHDWLPTKFEQGARRFEVRVPTSSRASIVWLRSLGFQIECELPGYATNGEPHYQLALWEPHHVPTESTEGRAGRARDASPHGQVQH